MNREETAKILTVMSTAYPNFKVEDKVATLNTWEFLLTDYSYQDISIALKTYITTSNSSYAPSISNLIAMAHRPAELIEMGDSEAWAMVRRAISRGNYYSEQDFAEFPEAVKRAVGSPAQLRMWAGDSKFNEGVESSNFYRRYAIEMKRERDISRLPAEAKALMAKLQSPLLEEKG